MEAGLGGEQDATNVTQPDNVALSIIMPIGLEHEHEGLVDLLSMKAYHFEGIFGEVLKEACLF